MKSRTGLRGSMDQFTTSHTCQLSEVLAKALTCQRLPVCQDSMYMHMAHKDEQHSTI